MCKSNIEFSWLLRRLSFFSYVLLVNQVSYHVNYLSKMFDNFHLVFYSYYIEFQF